MEDENSADPASFKSGLPLSQKQVEQEISQSDSYFQHDKQLRAEQEATQAKLTKRLVDIDKELRNAVNTGRLTLLGLETEDTIKKLEALIEDWVKRYRRIIFYGEMNTTLAEFLLQALSQQEDWNHYLLKQGLPQVYFVDIEEKIDSPEPQSTLTVDLSGIGNENTLSLLAAGLIDNSYIRQIHQGAKAAYSRWQNLAQPEDIEGLTAYQFAVTQVRQALTGQDISIFLMFSTTLRLYAVWLAQLFNQELGQASLPIWFSGEWATDYFHSTQQAWAQAKGFEHNEEIRQRERRGFISLTFFNPQGQGDCIVQGPANQGYRGFGYGFLLRIAKEALRISMQLARRPIVEVDFRALTLQDLGSLIYFGQVSAVMAGRLAETFTPKPRSAQPHPEILSAESISDATLIRQQNILTFKEINGEIVLGGIIGEAIQRGNEEFLEKTLSIMSKFVGAGGLAKVINDYQSGAKLAHLNPDEILRDIALTEAMAMRFKTKKRIYAISIGGSSTGETLVQALNLKEGPRLIGVHSFDADIMNGILEDIRRYPEELAIVVISKSGVTAETDANGWTLIETLVKALSVNTTDEVIKEHILFITDPQLGTLRHQVIEQGYLSLNHHGYIGGRFSLWSNVGLFFYFLKGGKRSDLENALVQWKEWHNELKSASKAIHEFKPVFDSSISLSINPERSRRIDSTAQIALSEHIKALYIVYLLIKDIPGVWEGLLDNLINTLPPAFSRDTEVAISFSDSYRSLVGGPLYAQIRSESKSKLGVRFYSCGVWGRSAIKRVWERITHNPYVYVTMLGESKAEDNTWIALQNDLRQKNVPFMSTFTGPTNIASLFSVTWLQYLRLAVDCVLYEPMKVSSEGQSGVELTKNVFRAVLAKIHNIIRQEEQSEQDRLRREGLAIPRIPAHEIEAMTDVSMHLRDSFNLNEELVNIITDVLIGNDNLPGLATQATRNNLEFMEKIHIPKYLSNLIIELFKQQDTVKRIYLDRRRLDLGGRGPYLVRATSIESPINLITSSANGTNFGIYVEEPNSKNLILKVSVRIIWGSSVRLVVSDGRITQDYLLLDDGRLIEVDKSKEDNSMIMAVVGTYLALSGRSTLRPQGFLEFDRQILRPSVDTKIRISDAPTPDMYKIMVEQGLCSAWISWPEARELAQIMESASGFAMVMTPCGLQHISNISDQNVLADGDILESNERVYVYAGNPDSVKQVQIFLDFLQVAQDTPPVLEILKALGNIPEKSTCGLRAMAIMWALRLREGLQALPLQGLRGRVKEIVDSLQISLEETLKHLNEVQTIRTLRAEYLGISLEERSLRANEFILLGHPDANMRVQVPAGEATRLVYGLEKAFHRVTSWTLMTGIQNALSQAGLTDILTTLQEAQDILQKDYQRDGKLYCRLKEHGIPEIGFAESIEDYFEDNLPQDAQQVLNRILEVYLSDQEVKDVESDELLADLKRNEPELFYEKDGKIHLRSLRWIQRNLRERKTGVTVNQSGDVSSRLDDIFNRLLIYFSKPLVEIIISEEESDPIRGSRSGFMLMLDPIDGSSQIISGGTYGTIVTLGVLLPEQSIKDFDAFKQVIAGFDLLFGPRTRITLYNPCNSKGRAEAAYFELTQDKNLGKLVFRRETGYESLSLGSIEDNLKWQGLLPQANIPQTAIHIAMGGSFIESSSHHTKLIAWLMDTYGYELDYTGALANDIGKIISTGALYPQETTGFIHTYGSTNDYPGGRFRLAFEEYFYSLIFFGWGGEVIDGQKPMLDNRLTETKPSKLTKPFYAASRWITKLIMAWNTYIQIRKISEEQMDEAWLDFLKYYQENSQRLIASVAQEESLVRRVLLDWWGDISFLLDPDYEDRAIICVNLRLEPGSAAILAALGERDAHAPRGLS